MNQYGHRVWGGGRGSGMYERDNKFSSATSTNNTNSFGDNRNSLNTANTACTVITRFKRFLKIQGICSITDISIKVLDDYIDYLKGDLWTEIRDRILKESKYTCVCCDNEYLDETSKICTFFF